MPGSEQYDHHLLFNNALSSYLEDQRPWPIFALVKKTLRKCFNISWQKIFIGHSAVENCVRRCTEGGGHIALNSAREMLFCGVPPSGPDRISPQISKDIFIKLRDLLI